MTLVQVNEKAANGTAPSTQKDYNLIVHLSEIEVDEDFNARTGDNAYRNIPELALSIQKTGQLNELQVMENKKGAKCPWFLIGGFRRARAFALIAKEEKSDPEIRILVKHFDGARFDERLVEARYANLASDGGTNPLRDFEYAERCNYFHSKLGASAKKIAQFIGKSEAVVYTYLKLFEKLTPEVRTSWASAPDPEKEIPISKLQSWAKHTPSEQKALMEKYISGDDSPVYQGGGKDEGSDPDKPKKRIDKERPGTKDIKAELEKIEAKREDARGSEQAKLEGASKALRFVLGDISRIF